jgi:glyoxylase-like metal-dependent hydrolase (beta-lactamase superfamily II)
MTSHWADPGCHPVGDGVFRVPLQMPGDGLQAVNVYVLETGDGLVLIDGGWRTPTALEELQAALVSIGHTSSEIHDIYVTHIHRDHYTLAVELRRRFGPRVHLGRLESVGLHQLLEIESNVPLTSLAELERSGDPVLAESVEATTRAEPFDAAAWEKPDVWLDPGECAAGGRTLHAVHTPGHTRGHMVFHDMASAQLFAGDHLLPTISPSIGFELGEWDLPLARYLTSLQGVLERPDARLLPAHGAPAGSAHTRAAELLEHHEERLRQTREALDRAGPSTASAVARMLRWTRRGRSYDELDDFNRMIATCETIAHLDVLVEKSEARVSSDGAVAVFSAA